ncbi:pentatricopeptide repeat-containing protein At2g20710, mitochondrial-like [Gastrolobium bilobum]|uniref:pentatricopeptide repeat-containing protein At2g20710, mitochondrial-like n=1 Tax=Gastrolobium bilobum TaxID=150636 RepID=UPI002AB154BC|nr:pentatricopeptide repeat-containing protein At2g20710, mitochondrial-like [Gastrolobium bilobum]
MMLIRSRCKLFDIFRVGSLPLYSTEAVVSSPPALEKRILESGNPKISMVPILNQWVEEGKDVTQPQLQRIITQLSNFRRFTHALQVSEWMSNERNYNLTPGDIAKRLNLISKVHGLEQAESFFRGIPDTEIGFKVYAALLSCYAEHKSLEEAEAIMEKIKKLDLLHLTTCYNMMLKLYAQIGKYEKLDRLMQEMKEKDICNGATFTIRLNAYVAGRDIKGMEKLLMQMEADPMATVDWCTYTTAANGYLKIGDFEKALVTLKKSEQLVRGKTMRLAYESIQSMYAAIGNKEEVYRLWDKIKSFNYSHNSSYISMLSSLVKLDDIDGAEKILEEWESEHIHFDARIPNLMITAYCKRGLLDKAEAYIRRLLDSGKELDGTTWDRLAGGYLMDNDMEKAVQTMKKAILVNGQPRWWPNPFTLVACIKYLKEKGDLELALEILKLCREDGHISVTTYDKLVSYVHNEIPVTEALDLIKGDFKLDEDAQLLVGEN